MKKFDVYKTIQLIIFVCLTGLGLLIVIGDSELYQLIANNSHIRILCILLWASLGLSFLFTFMDFSLFSAFKREYRELDFAVYSDPVSGIANRYSCDAVIEKYLDKPLPDSLGCIMFDLSNIRDINDRYGHMQGNNAIREFSSILKSASIDLCFVGRNGGNKFLAIFEDCSNRKIKEFIDAVNTKVSQNNASSESIPIEYRYGIAFHEGSDATNINELIALSNNRIYSERK
ncbi:MAG: GGDEF domain-containing protein [Bacillota bacterium]|nr:GGDEF domain-containing protein [Bacillota bacterium]